MSHDALPPPFAGWFARRGWAPRAHQRAALAAARAGRSYLVTAPTGGGKTLAGLLPSLVDLHERAADGALHTLYVSPLKALAVDVARNIEAPAREMGLGVRIEARTGDTPPARRQRQKTSPPDILLTTPEQVSLLLSDARSGAFFSGLRAVVVDELHALADTKRGALLALALERLKRLAPALRVAGLSATAADPDRLRRWISTREDAPALHIAADGGARAEVEILASQNRVPWSGHSARYAWGDIYERIRRSRLALVFVNTRSQAEMTFQALWAMNEDDLPIALHHGSLDVERRRKVEAAMARGALRAVVCTSTLDLGIDWGDVDLVIQIGAPKGASRLTQRIGRANHRMDEASTALLVPGNRFEVLECVAATDALMAGELDADIPREGALDVLAQHIVCVACGGPFDADALYAEVTAAAPYAALPRETFDRVLDFAATGGYALRAYDRHRRIVRTPAGTWRIASARAAQQYRLNAGTIVEAPALNVRLLAGRGPKRGGRRLGTVEEWYVDGLAPGDAFLFAGEVLRFEGVEGPDALVTRATGAEPRVPTWSGARFPLTTHLAARVRRLLHDRRGWKRLPPDIREWLDIQRAASRIPGPDELLVETFPHHDRHFLLAYPFEGRLAHQTLGMLLTRRLERLGMQPLGFVPTDYSLSVWGRRDMSGVDLDALFDEDMLGDDLESWLAESVLMKRTFRDCALIAGLIDRNHPGTEKSGRQVMFSADLIYDVLKEHEPDHILLQAAWADAARGYLDIARLQALLSRAKGRIVHAPLARVSPLAVPVMMEINRETIVGEGHEAMLAEASEALIAEAMGMRDETPLRR